MFCVSFHLLVHSFVSSRTCKHKRVQNQQKLKLKPPGHRSKTQHVQSHIYIYCERQIKECSLVQWLWIRQQVQADMRLTLASFWCSFSSMLRAVGESRRAIWHKHKGQKHFDRLIFLVTFMLSFYSDSNNHYCHIIDQKKISSGIASILFTVQLVGHILWAFHCHFPSTCLSFS